MNTNLVKAQEASWFEVENIRLFEIKGFQSQSPVWFFPEKGGGALMRIDTASALGNLIITRDLDFRPQFAAGMSNGLVRFFDSKEFTLNDIAVSEFDGTVLFNWNAAVSAADIYSFNILKSTDSIHFVIIGNVPAEDTSIIPEPYIFQDTVLTPGAIYKVQIVGLEKGVRYTTQPISILNAANRSMPSSNSSTVFSQVKVFPTITSNLVNVVMPEGLTCTEYKVFNLQGTTLITEKINKNSFIISLQMLEPGLYLIQINDGKSNSVNKIIKL